MTISNAFIRQYFSYKRPDGSPTEKKWIDTYIIPRLRGKHWVDGAGNIHYDGRIDSTNRTLFVGHTDTVHNVAGSQMVTIGNGGKLRVANPKQTNCLGADDGAGVLVLLAMIEAGVPAYYIFTRCEERGGKGAKYLHTAHSELLMQFDRAIAFDRKGTSSVVTHQGWGRCCSDTFADALSETLSNDVLMYAPDEGGVYTDTAEFVDIIPECTNLSVGYVNEHTTKETLDLNHMKALIARVIGIEWDALPTERDPSVEDYEAYNYKPLPSQGYSQYNMDAYTACEQAMQGDTALLMWRICEALEPEAPDSWYYEQLWGMAVPESLIRECMKTIDYANEDEQVAKALCDLHDAMFDQLNYH